MQESPRDDPVAVNRRPPLRGGANALRVGPIVLAPLSTLLLASTARGATATVGLGSAASEETLQMTAGEPGGPFALALSARSNALQEFEGGPGQVAMHGRAKLGGTLGTAASHGCIRLDTASIDWLAARIGPGTPVTIYGG